MFRAANRAIKIREKVLEQGNNRLILNYLRLYYFNQRKSNRILRALNCYNSRINFKGSSAFRNTCIITGRSRAVTSVGLSRMQLRKFMMMGCVKGLKKHYW